nr:hypothetical protein [Bacteroidales bacterium]
KIAEKIPYSKIVYKSGADTPIDFNLTFNFETSDSATTASVISFSGNLNSMLKMMLTNPLQNFVNILNQKLKEFFNKN